jgi:hypothetical protein
MTGQRDKSAVGKDKILILTVTSFAGFGSFY